MLLERCDEEGRAVFLEELNRPPKDPNELALDEALGLRRAG